MRGKSMRSGIATVVVTLAMISVPGPAVAHDFWLVPNAFRVAAGTPIEVRGQTSSRFPTSEAAVAGARVADARLLMGGDRFRITDLSVDGTSLLLRHTGTSSGQSVVAVALHPVSLRISAEGFRRYLELEGAPEALARVNREGLLAGRDSVTRRYAKYAKAIIEVGSGGSRAYPVVAGHPLEFIPANDPSSMSVGDTLTLRLLYRGQPLVNAPLHAGFVPAPEGRVQLTSASPASDYHLATDGNGWVRVPLSHAGLWNVRAIHVVQADAGSGADWDTHWATFVFSTNQNSRATGVSSARADSSDVADAVNRYHHALETGDSAAALALLTDDAVILESGGVETRAEYRSHHLPGDIAFARTVRSVRDPMTVTVKGDVAWASSTSTSQGEFNGRAINSAGAELMVLVRTSEGWKIAAIHWSARRRQ